MTIRPWVYCRACVHFRPYRTFHRAGLGYCAVNTRRHELDKNQRRRCRDHQPSPEPD